MGRAIVVTSGKGGVGKTTTSFNIGTGLALANKRVVLVDADIGLRNLDVAMGLENRIVFDLVDVVENKCRMQQALVKDKRFDDYLYLLPASQTKEKSAVTAEQFKQLTTELKRQYDYVIIDCPAGIEQGFRNAVAGVDEAIVVTTPENTAIRDADRVIGLLEKEEIQPPKLIVNRLRPDMVRGGDIIEVDEIVQVLAIDLLGVVPDDANVIKGSNRGEPLAMDTNSRAGRAYLNISKRILGEAVPLMPLYEKTSWWKRMKKWFGNA
ncbi:septum site-determining protein MinD [Numidum massiliense]|uniref:septum site-determining protein MinD n=1 Tax=Numidum massiliense TaxID=1522315 RepID=UPI0006D59669|nr:septum site-determining protein MinD [Numidum massiliense]